MARKRPQATRTDDLDSKSARTRARILDAAAQVLSVKGFAGMRLSDVAEQAEVQAPAIYYYFDSREGLIEEVMWSGISQMGAHLEQALAEVGDDADPIERILAASEAHLRHELEISSYATAAIRNAGQVPPQIRERFVAGQNAYGEQWAALFRAAADEGLLRPDLDPYIARMLVFGALNWAAEWWDPTRGELDELIANTRRFVRHAIVAD